MTIFIAVSNAGDPRKPLAVPLRFRDRGWAVTDSVENRGKFTITHVESGVAMPYSFGSVDLAKKALQLWLDESEDLYIDWDEVGLTDYGSKRVRWQEIDFGEIPVRDVNKLLERLGMRGRLKSLNGMRI